VRHAEGIQDVRRRVLDGPGYADAAVRRAAFTGDDLPETLATYVTKVINNAYKVTDSDVAAIKQMGYSENEIFEITVAAALGAGYRRFEAGRKAMER